MTNDRKNDKRCLKQKRGAMHNTITTLDMTPKTLLQLITLCNCLVFYSLTLLNWKGGRMITPSVYDIN